MRCASFRPGAGGPSTYLRTDGEAAGQAFDFGTADFTVVASLETTTGGAILSRSGAPGAAATGGFGVYVDPRGAIVFYTDDGTTSRAVATMPTRVLDGTRHTIAAMRQGGALSIRVDGRPQAVNAVTADGADGQPLDVDSQAPLCIGYGRSVRPGLADLFFTGLILNVSLWRQALPPKLQTRAAVARLDGSETGLCAFWSLDGSVSDVSANAARNELQVAGDPSGFAMTATSNLVFTQGPNDLAFLQIYGPDYPQTTLYNFEVVAGVPFFGLSIMANDDSPTFPTGAVLTLTDPSGVTYGTQNINTDTIFAACTEGSLWAFMAACPPSGTWQIAVSTQGSVLFTLTAQTYPSLPGSFPYSSQEALEPVFGSSSESADAVRVTASSSGWAWGWAAAAVAVTATVVVVGAIATGATISAPVLVSAILVVGLLEVAEAHAVNMRFGTMMSLRKAVVSTTGLTALKPEKGMVLYWDQNLAGDQYMNSDPNLILFPQTSYAARLALLYSWIFLSEWNMNSNSYQGRDVVPAQINAAISDSTVVYVTASGHGTCNYIGGWFDDSGTGKTQRILCISEIQNLNIFTGKIFHFWACNTGILDCATATGSANPDGTTGPGLGATLVKLGATAFFGYNSYVYLSSDIENAQKYIACDIVIDTKMLSGYTCDEAYQASIELYSQTYDEYIADGNTEYAEDLQNNWKALVAPSTNSAYGSKAAFLITNTDD